MQLTWKEIEIGWLVLNYSYPRGRFFAHQSFNQMDKLEQLERLRSEIPPAAPWLPITVIHIRSQVKTRQSQSYKFKKIGKNSNFENLHSTLNATHLLELLDKMHKYETVPTITVGATEQTRDAGTDGGTDRRMDRQSETNIPPQQLLCAYIVWDEITYRFPNFNGAIKCAMKLLIYSQTSTMVEVWEYISNFIPHFYCTFKVWEWISNFIPQFIMDVIPYPRWY